MTPWAGPELGRCKVSAVGDSTVHWREPEGDIRKGRGEQQSGQGEERQGGGMGVAASEGQAGRWCSPQVSVSAVCACETGVRKAPARLPLFGHGWSGTPTAARMRVCSSCLCSRSPGATEIFPHT